jgi:N-carbamoylputrescine amidase
MSDSEQHLKIVLVQGGAGSSGGKVDIQGYLELIDRAAESTPDFVVLSELFGLPTFGYACDPRYLDWAESLSGPTLQALSERALQHRVNIVAPFFEKGALDGVYYNSAAVIDRSGRLIPGTLPGGKTLPCYRKTHVPNVVLQIAEDVYLPYDESYYFRPGSGLPVFDTDSARLGILICADRCFPEAWRVLALQGAQIVFVPAAVASWAPGGDGGREALFVAELQIRALENGFFVAACNKGGREVFEGTDKIFFGDSCIIDPYGQVMAQGPRNDGPALVEASFSLDEITQARHSLPLFKWRRPELYSQVCVP